MKTYKELNDKFINFQKKHSENIKEYVVTGFFLTLNVALFALINCAIFKINVVQLFS